MRLFGKNRTFGLDVGSYAVKLVELDETSKGYRVRNVAIARIPPESIVDGDIINTIGVSETLRSLFREVKLKTKQVSLGVGGHAGVMQRKIKVPIMSREELENSIKWEAEQYLPPGLTMDEVYMDFVVLDTLSEEGQMEVSLVFAKKDIVNNYVAILTDLGYDPVVVDYKAFALQNAFELNYPLAEDEVIVLLDIGASMYTINVVKGDKSLYIRDVSGNAGNFITEELQKNLGVDYEDAENMKRGGAEGRSPEADRIIKSAVETMAEAVATDIKRVVGTLAEDTSVSKLLVCGGAVMSDGFVEKLQEKTGIPVEIIDPFKQLIMPKEVPSYVEENRSQFTVAVGLALRKPYE